MRITLWRGSIGILTLLLSGSAVLAACVGDDPSSDVASGSDASTGDGAATTDGNTGDALAPPASGFVLSLSPAHITADPGDANIAVTINVVRAASFTDDVSFTIVPPPNVTASAPADTGNTGTQSSFNVSVGSGASLGDVSVTITGQNPSKTFVETATLQLHIGSLLDIGDGGFVVPSYASSLVVKAWGAGGGSAFGTTPVAGSIGGAGGYATATIAVTPGASLVARIATGGAGQSDGSGYGAGGGGYTALCPRTGACFVIAAGGGGGGGNANGSEGDTSGAGGAGGGLIGESGTSSDCAVATGGTQSAGGTAGLTCDGTEPKFGSNGGSLLGGAGAGTSTPIILGGVPGGGAGGNLSGGGGGGGYFGGAGGTWDMQEFYGGGGGGGGSSLSPDAGVASGTGATPPLVDPRCPSGTGVGGTDGGAGGPGCILVILGKP